MRSWFKVGMVFIILGLVQLACFESSYNRLSGIHEIYGEPDQPVPIGQSYLVYSYADQIYVSFSLVGNTGYNGTHDDSLMGRLVFPPTNNEELQLNYSSRSTSVMGPSEAVKAYIQQIQYVMHPDAPLGFRERVRGFITGSMSDSLIGEHIVSVYYNPEVAAPPTDADALVRGGSPFSNFPPVNTVPGVQGITYQHPHVMNFLVDDSDIGVNIMRVTIQVGQGTLTVEPATGATVGGNGTNIITITGRLEVVNNTLLGGDGVGLNQGVSYRYTGAPLSAGQMVVDTLTFTSRDNRDATATNTVRLEITNPVAIPVAPVATVMPTCHSLDVMFPSVSLQLGTPLNLDLSPLVSDPDAHAPFAFWIISAPYGAILGDVFVASDDEFAAYNGGSPYNLMVLIGVTDVRGCTGEIQVAIDYQ